jgi:hypothetical protein
MSPPHPAPPALSPQRALLLTSTDQAAWQAWLMALLRLRGIDVALVDVRLPRSRAQVPALLAEAQAVILVIDPSMLTQGATLRQLASSGRHLISLLPILDGVADHAIEPLFHAVGLDDLIDRPVRIDRLGSTSSRDHILTNLAGTIAQACLRAAIGHMLPDQPLTIDLFNRGAPVYADSALLRIDARQINLFDAASRPWATLHQALLELKETISGQRPLAIRHTYCQLGLAYLFGFVFRATTLTELRIAPPSVTSDMPHDWWSTRTLPSAPPLLRETETPIPDADPDGEILLEIRLVRNTAVAVDAWIQRHARPIRRRIVLAPADGSERLLIADATQAATLAHQIGDTVQAIRHRSADSVIHLFSAIPVGLAVLIGSRLNRCGPIQYYDQDADNTYQPVCLLG